LLRCPQCAEIWRALRALRLEAHAFDPEAPPPELEPDLLRRRRPWLTRLALALAGAGAAAILLLALPRAGHRPAQPPVAHGREVRGTEPSGGPRPVAPRGTVRKPVQAFAWRPATGDASYVVELLDAEGRLLWRSPEVTGGSLPWPEAVPQRTGTYYWRVLELAAGEAKPRSSPLARFDLVLTASRP
ncbi:MAG: hypothetical protein D6739_12420, partial [Nitrospirae bacterium]